MASSTVIQYLQAGAGLGVSNRQITETFLAGAAIAKNAIVALDLNQSDDSDKLLTVITAASGTAASSIAIGVALQAAGAVGGNVEVLLRGIASSVAIDGSGTAVAAGDGLILSGSKFVKAVAGEAIVAQSLGAVTTDTTGKVFVISRF